MALTVDGDADKEYIISMTNPGSTNVGFRFNAGTGNNYGYQFLQNNAGTISASRNINDSFSGILDNRLGITYWHVLTPTGFIKTVFTQQSPYGSGTTVNRTALMGGVWNNTANVTSINFLPTSGNFTTGMRITVYARRSNV